MPTLQIRSLSNELHAALVARAEAERMSMSAYVARVLEADLALPTTRQWVEETRQAVGAGDGLAIDLEEAMADTRPPRPMAP